MGPYLITAKLMRPSNMKRFPTPGLDLTTPTVVSPTLRRFLFALYSANELNARGFTLT
jgi:hypothetical protein